MNPALSKLLTERRDPIALECALATARADVDALVRENSQLRQKLHEELQQRRETFGDLQRRAHLIAKDKGFWQRDFGPETHATKLALIASEVSEALEADRESWEYFASAAVPRRIMSKKIPGFSTFEEELADVVIRTMDLAERRKLNLGGAIKAKLAYNELRPVRHGKAY